MIPKFDNGFVFDAASAPDTQRLSGPAPSPPPSSWISPGVSSEPWYGPYGTPVDEWKSTNGYTGYGTDPEPTLSWKFDVDLPSGWYTRIVNLHVRADRS